MEFIKKKICLDDFVSHIPGLNETIDGEDLLTNANGSWGKIPKNLTLWDTEVKYGTIMNLYYQVLDIVRNAVYYEYDTSGSKWMVVDFDWRDAFNTNNILFSDNLPTDELSDKMIVGVTKTENLSIFYDDISQIGGTSHNGLDLITNVNDMMGIHIVPYAYVCKSCSHIKISKNAPQICEECGSGSIEPYQPPFMPYFLYLKEIPKWIDYMNNLKTDICCEKKPYNEHGGDAFLEYLTKLKDDGYFMYTNGTEMATIDIPLLLTSKIRDIGQYRAYDVDDVDENGNIIDDNIVIESQTTIVEAVGESKLKTLRKRKRSVDDNGAELPFILTKTEDGYQMELPYQVNYLKNIQIVKDKFYADTITSIKETCTPKETNLSMYNVIIEKLTDQQHFDGTTTNYMSGLLRDDVCPDIIRYGSKDKNTSSSVTSFFNSDSMARESMLRTKMLKYFSNVYPDILCVKQDFQFDYELTYGVEDYENTYTDEEGNIITPIKEEKLSKTHSGTIYIMFDQPMIEYTYVLGAKFKKQHLTDKLKLDETNPFFVSETKYHDWDGSGIWYREKFPIKKVCVQQFLIDGVMREFTYDYVDFGANEVTYTFNGIDFPRKNYILCEEIRYKSDAYKADVINDPIFRDEKMLGLNYPLKESYDVAVERSSSAAFEKHLQLSEVKTWQDLENYRNGLFLNK
jgi:hypothetical protein